MHWLFHRLCESMGAEHTPAITHRSTFHLLSSGGCLPLLWSQSQRGICPSWLVFNCYFPDREVKSAQLDRVRNQFLLLGVNRRKLPVSHQEKKLFVIWPWPTDHVRHIHSHTVSGVCVCEDGAPGAGKESFGAAIWIHIFVCGQTGAGKEWQSETLHFFWVVVFFQLKGCCFINQRHDGAV